MQRSARQKRGFSEIKSPSTQESPTQKKIESISTEQILTKLNIPNNWNSTSFCVFYTESMWNSLEKSFDRCNASNSSLYSLHKLSKKVINHSSKSSIMLKDQLNEQAAILYLCKSWIKVRSKILKCISTLEKGRHREFRDNPPLFSLFIHDSVESMTKTLSKLDQLAPLKSRLDSRTFQTLWLLDPNALKEHCLICRNLNFNVNIQDLNSIFSKHGKLFEITCSSDPKNHQHNRGFAFIQFISKNDAIKCLKNQNGVKFQEREMILDFLKDDNTENESDSSHSQKKKKTTQQKDSKKQSTENTEEDDESIFKHMLFLQNVPFDASETDINKIFFKFGKIQRIKVFRDKRTNLTTGSAWIRFKSNLVPKKVLEAAYPRPEMAGLVPSDVFVINGRPLKISQAITKGKLDKKIQVRQQEKSVKDNPDKRNIYLLVEGLINEESESWADLSTTDQKKRTEATEIRMQKLSNSNFSISNTRLSFRNIPKNRNETEIYELIKKFIVEYYQDNPHFKKPEYFLTKRSTKLLHPHIVQVKILREKTGLLGDDGLPKSKGRGYIQFEDHQDALACLRSMNNNPDVFGSHSRPIIEFAVDFMPAVKKMERTRVLGSVLSQDSQSNRRDSRHRDNNRSSSKSGTKGGYSNRNPRKNNFPSHSSHPRNKSQRRGANNHRS